jgi:hypothetical protein
LSLYLCDCTASYKYKYIHKILKMYLNTCKLKDFNCLNRSAAPLPDTGQWLLLALNEKLPKSVVDLLRAHIITLHHYLMLFIMLGFSVLFDCIKAPGLGIATRYMFTMAIGRLLRTITFIATILPSARPWCAVARYQIPEHPHPWAQKYYVPYASDSSAIRRVITNDMAYGQFIFPIIN